MAEAPHYKEILRTLNESEVEYLVVGGHAVMKYGEPRYTKDLDLWVRNSPENAVRVCRALARFGAPLQHDGVTPETFTRDRIVYQIGVAPVRIDISTHIDGVEFDLAWPNRVAGELFGVPVSFLSFDDLVANKRASGRRIDFEDLDRIRRPLQ